MMNVFDIESGHFAATMSLKVNLNQRKQIHVFIKDSLRRKQPPFLVWGIPLDLLLPSGGAQESSYDRKHPPQWPLPVLAHAESDPVPL